MRTYTYNEAIETAAMYLGIGDRNMSHFWTERATEIRDQEEYQAVEDLRMELLMMRDELARETDPRRQLMLQWDIDEAQRVWGSRA